MRITEFVLAFLSACSGVLVAVFIITLCVEPRLVLQAYEWFLNYGYQ